MDLDDYDPEQVRQFLTLFGHAVSQEDEFPFDAIHDCLGQMMRIACYEADSLEAKILREKGYNSRLGATLRLEMHATLTQNFCVQAAKNAGPESLAEMIRGSDSYPQSIRDKPENFDLLEKEYSRFLDNIDVLYTCGLLIKDEQAQQAHMPGGLLDFGFLR